MSSEKLDERKHLDAIFRLARELKDSDIPVVRNFAERLVLETSVICDQLLFHPGRNDK